MTSLRQRFQGRLVLDGATGTELDRRGVPTLLPLWSAGALQTHPQVVEQIHRDYVEAGAEILVANTFRTNSRTLRWAGWLEEGETLNRRAIELARRAARAKSAPDRLEAGSTRHWLEASATASEANITPAEDRATPSPVLVAASVAPVEDCYCPERVPDETALREEHGQMMAWLKAAGPDLVWIETMNTIREAVTAARAAVEAGLPFVVSLVTREEGALLGGETLENAVAAIEPLEPLAIGLNCIPPRSVTALLPRLRNLTSRPLAAYAHIGNPEPIHGWSFSQAVPPAEYAADARQWLDAGATIIGGCCGTTPEHIRAAAKVVKNSG